MVCHRSPSEKWGQWPPELLSVPPVSRLGRRAPDMHLVNFSGTWTKSLCPPDSYAEVLPCSVMASGDGAFGRLLALDEVIRVELLIGLVSLEGEDMQKHTIYKPGRGSPTRGDHAATLIMHSQPAELGEMSAARPPRQWHLSRPALPGTGLGGSRKDCSDCLCAEGQGPSLPLSTTGPKGHTDLWTQVWSCSTLPALSPGTWQPRWLRCDSALLVPLESRTAPQWSPGPAPWHPLLQGGPELPSRGDNWIFSKSRIVLPLSACFSWPA